MKLNTEEFIKRSNIIHGYEYDYSKVVYMNNDSKVIIGCKKHGYFEQTPKSHMKGHKCFKCKNNFLTNEEFIEKSNIVHNNEYLYNNSIFKGMNKKIIITCKKHGDFEQLAKSHLRGHRCQRCYKEKISKDDILDRLKKINNDYTYDDFEYNKRVSEIFLTITCKKHGKFIQRLSNHIYQNNGCPYCKRSKGEEELNSILKEKNIMFEREKTFDGCKNIKMLPFDFYLSKYNICLEYDGVQHFKPSYGKEQFEYLKNNDKIKNTYCLNNQIKLIRIKYDQDIEDTLINNGII